MLVVGWTLNFEMFFYLVFSLGLLFKRYMAGISMSLLILGAFALTSFFGPYDNVFLKFYAPLFMLEFAFGMVIAITLEQGIRLFSAAKWEYPLKLTLFLSLAALTLLPAFSQVADLGIISGGLPAALAVFSALMLEARGNYTRSLFLITAGDASHSLYLMNPFVAQVSSKLVEHFHPGKALALGIGAANSVIVVAIALVMYRLIEKPLTRSARSFLAAKPASAS
jgi:peptidoglycan/LPS O-acetylase OafA/YrhL